MSSPYPRCVSSYGHEERKPPLLARYTKSRGSKQYLQGTDYANGIRPVRPFSQHPPRKPDSSALLCIHAWELGSPMISTSSSSALPSSSSSSSSSPLSPRDGPSKLTYSSQENATRKRQNTAAALFDGHNELRPLVSVYTGNIIHGFPSTVEALSTLHCRYLLMQVAGGGILTFY